MNIFILDVNTDEAVKALHDRHVVKMITESCQMLSTWIRRAKDDKPNAWTKIEFLIDDLYKPTHANHPCNLWLLESIGNVNWLIDYTNKLIDEYDYRFGRTDAFTRARKVATIAFGIKETFYRIESDCPETFPIHMTPFALAMPTKYKNSSAVESYRKYYAHEKIFQDHVKWTKREIPSWLFNFPEEKIQNRLKQLVPRKIPGLKLSRSKAA